MKALRPAPNRHGRSRRRRRGAITFEWIVLFTLLFVGALAGFALLNYSLARHQEAVRVSVEGMNFPAQPETLGMSSSSAPTLAGPAP